VAAGNAAGFKGAAAWARFPDLAVGRTSWQAHGVRSGSPANLKVAGASGHGPCPPLVWTVSVVLRKSAVHWGVAGQSARARGHVCSGLEAAVGSLVLGLILAGGAAPALAVAGNPGNTFMYAPDANTTHQRCLGIKRNGDARLWPCTYKHDQAWYRGHQFRSTGFYQYKNANGQCLSVAGGSTGKGAQVIAGKCLSGSKHEDYYWHLDFLGHKHQTYECYVFNYKSGYVLEPGSDKRGSKIEQEPWKGHKHTYGAQVWFFEINS
jgi:hypothetical protein